MILILKQVAVRLHPKLDAQHRVDEQRRAGLLRGAGGEEGGPVQLDVRDEDGEQEHGLVGEQVVPHRLVAQTLLPSPRGPRNRGGGELARAALQSAGERAREKKDWSSGHAHAAGSAPICWRCTCTRVN